MKILGIDPGTARTGFGMIEIEDRLCRVRDYGVIETSSDLGLAERLEILAQDLNQLIGEHRPELVVIEKLFFSKNVKTAMSVAEARGVIELVVSRAGIEVHEITAGEVKQQLCGYGAADKHQIQVMVTKLLGLKTIPEPDDAADALALAICGSYLKTAVMYQG